jgi:hypothetical protein
MRKIPGSFFLAGALKKEAGFFTATATGRAGVYNARERRVR